MVGVTPLPTKTHSEKRRFARFHRTYGSVVELAPPRWRGLEFEIEGLEHHLSAAHSPLHGPPRHQEIEVQANEAHARFGASRGRPPYVPLRKSLQPWEFFQEIAIKRPGGP